MGKSLAKIFYSKNSIKSKQYALTNLVTNSTRVTNQIQANIANLQSTNSEIDSTIKEIEDMKTQYSVLAKELQNRIEKNRMKILLLCFQKTK